jgi:hypothetical protein
MILSGTRWEFLDSDMLPSVLKKLQDEYLQALTEVYPQI